MKLLLLTLIVLEAYLVIFAISSFSPFISYKRMVQAYDAWHKFPTKENEAVWLQEKAAYDHKKLVENACVYALLAGNAVGIVSLFRRVQNQTSKR